MKWFLPLFLFFSYAEGAINLPIYPYPSIKKSSVPLNSIDMKIPSSKKSQFDRKGEALVIKALINDNDFVMDIGANVGEWSNAVIKLHPKAKIIAFEPIPNVFETLKKKLAGHHSIQFENFAVSDKTGKTIFNYYPQKSVLSGIAHRSKVDRICRSKPKKIQVPLETLDNYCKRKDISHIDFLKIDTEGNEVPVLKGAVKLLKQQAATKVQFEYGGAFKDAKQKLKSACLLLSNAGYAIFEITPKGLVYLDKWTDELENYKFTNFLAVAPSEAGDFAPMVMDHPDHPDAKDHISKGV